MSKLLRHIWNHTFNTSTAIGNLSGLLCHLLYYGSFYGKKQSLICSAVNSEKNGIFLGGRSALELMRQIHSSKAFSPSI